VNLAIPFVLVVILAFVALPTDNVLYATQDGAPLPPDFNIYPLVPTAVGA
jgi:hypothetical protein